MPNAFISYSVQDEVLARQIHKALTDVGVETFLASISLGAGADWTQDIFNALRSSEWVFFIASRAACQSSSVQQELGASLAQAKLIIPILIDIGPEDLPGWTQRYQAIDARAGGEQLSQTIQAIGETVRNQKFWTGVVLGGLAIALLSGLTK